MGISILCGLVLSYPPSAKAQAAVATPAFHPRHVLVTPKAGINPATLTALHAGRSAKVIKRFPALGGLQVVELPEGETVPQAIVAYQNSDLVQVAEPDYVRHLDLAPNDPQYLNGTLWGLNNTGQNGGVVDADIDAPEGWDVLSSASNIVVATLDTGIRRTHEDLVANVWTNPIAGGYGWNAISTNSAPGDDEGHGTLIAGVLGAVGNNGKGVVGVAWQVQIMACKSFDAAQNGLDSDIIEGIEFARTNGARVINASFGAPGFSSALSNAIYAARQQGIILVASSGNEAANVDVSPRYPACYGIDNIVSVAATTRTDVLWSSSNFGATNADLAAPGHQISSTFYLLDNFYLSVSGTSMAAPAVAGAIALMLVKYPTETHQQIITRLLNATDPLPALAGKCVTGGRLNLRNALNPPLRLLRLVGNLPIQFRVVAAPNVTFKIEASTNLSNWLPVSTNTTSADGIFDFSDSAPANSSMRFFRAVSW